MLPVTLQLLNFDEARTLATLAALQARRADLRAAVDRLVIGDFSCTFRNQHTVANRLESEAWRGFFAWAAAERLAVHWQLPLVVKESEFRIVLETARKVWPHVAGFVTGDPGMILALQALHDELGPRTYTYQANLINRRAAALVAAKVGPEYVRPLFHNRRFLHTEAGMPLDLVVYGNLMINVSTFCFHCGDLPTKCDYSCEAPKKLVMENEDMRLVGRSLLTVNRLDLIDDLPDMGAVARVTVYDLDLTPDEVLGALDRISRVRAAA